MENNKYKQTLLIAPDDVKSATNVNYNVDDNTVVQAIKTAQDIYLPDVIGKELRDSLKKLVYNSIVGETPNIEDEDKKVYSDLLELVEIYLQYKTQSAILDYITFKLRNIAVSKSSDTNINYASLDEIKYLYGNYEVLVNSAATEISTFLKNNREYFVELESLPCKCNDKLQLGKVFTDNKLYLG